MIPARPEDLTGDLAARSRRPDLRKSE